ncbi:MAG: MFS transporter [Sulfitobacter sp.]
MTHSQAPEVSPQAPVFVSEFCTPHARPFVLFAAILATALGLIDGHVVAIALPAMRGSLDASLIEAQWIHSAYMLTLSALILVGGALGDRFGLSRIFSGGITLFVVASVFCALAPTAPMMIAARTVQGVGAAIMVPGSLAIIARAYPKQERGQAIAIWAAAAAITTALGPILGGLTITFGGPEMWRIIFAINLPLGGLALRVLWRKVGPAPAPAPAPARDSVCIDLIGASTATVALLMLTWGLTQTGQKDGYAGLWIIGGILMFAGFLWTQKHAAHPMMPLTLFTNRHFAAANLMTFFQFGAIGMMFFFMPMVFIAGWGLSAIEASVVFAPMSVFISSLSTRAGRLADKIGLAPILAGGSALTALGYGLIGFLAPAQNLWGHILPAMCIVGLGMAAVVTPLSTAVMGAVSEDQSGIASGINNAVARMGALIAVAATAGLMAYLYDRSGGTGSFGVPSDTSSHAGAMTAAFRRLAFIATGLCLLSTGIAAVFMREPQR